MPLGPLPAQRASRLCPFLCVHNRPNTDAAWPSAGRELGAQQDSFFLCLVMSQASGGKTRIGGAASSGRRCTRVSALGEKAGLGRWLNLGTWMWPLQGGGLWAPAYRAKHLMSHIHHSATCCHRPPRWEEGTQTASHLGKLAREVAVSFSPRHAIPVLLLSCWRRESGWPHSCLCHSVIFASNSSGTFSNAPPVTAHSHPFPSPTHSL